MRSADEFDEVNRLIAAGMNDCQVARTTGIPRKTVWQWRVRKPVRPRLREGSASCGVDHEFVNLPSAAYAYPSACISATDAFHDFGRCGVSASPAIRGIQRSSLAAEMPSTC